MQIYNTQINSKKRKKINTMDTDKEDGVKNYAL